VNIDPANLPAIPTRLRQWIYLIYLLVLLAANSIDVFYETGDPWWLAGMLRVLNVVGLFIMGVVLAHTRLTPVEQAHKVAKEQEEPEVNPRFPALPDREP
jgi:membrane protein YdbS with pleckstrin-like domain